MQIDKKLVLLINIMIYKIVYAFSNETILTLFKGMGPWLKINNNLELFRI